MRKSRFCAAIIFALLAQQTEATASSIIDQVGKDIEDSKVISFIRLALKNIPADACDDPKMCAPATDAEMASPPLTLADGRAAMAHGIVSALATWCGLDFRRSFLPLLAFGKHQMEMNERQLILMSSIHGTFSAMQLKQYKESGTCPDAFRTNLDRQLPKIPSQ